MRLAVPYAALTDPDQNGLYAVSAVALSLFVFAYSTLFGAPSILAFYGLWLLPLALAPERLLRRPAPVLLLLLVPAVFTASTLWSDAAATSLRAGIQYGVTMLCGLVAARIVTGENLVLGGAMGGGLVLLYSAANPAFSFNYMDGSYAFNGAFASKNQLGYFATLALLFASALLWGYRTDRWVRPLAIGVLALALAMLWLSDSATSLLAAMAAGGAILFVRALLALAPRLRLKAIVAVVMACAVLAFTSLRLGAFGATLMAFGRDPSLTGRTYLWTEGMAFGAEQPWLGTGYNAFWVRGRPEAEHLWEVFHISGRTGFHFHNVLIEAYVGVGLLGLSVVVGLCLLLFAMPLATALRPNNGGTLLVMSALAVLFLVRASAEVDFITPHTAGTFLVAYLLLSLIDRHAARPAARPRPAPGGAVGGVAG
ncbi:MAG: O-antigen ligase family protein [Pseudomonadota bacterium]